MTKLQTDLNLDDADGFYADLVSTHRDLSNAESAALNARLVLLLANHIGERDLLDQALRVARSEVTGTLDSG